MKHMPFTISGYANYMYVGLQGLDFRQQINVH